MRGQVLLNFTLASLKFTIFSEECTHQKDGALPGCETSGLSLHAQGCWFSCSLEELSRFGTLQFTTSLNVGAVKPRHNRLIQARVCVNAESPLYYKVGFLNVYFKLGNLPVCT